MKTLSALILGLLISLPLAAEEQQTIKDLLTNFLEGASINDVETHERFWAEDLVYTSSSGARFGKADLMHGVQQAAEPDGSRYSGDQITLRMHGETAVLTFRLIAESPDGQRQYFYNTGVLRQHDGRWQATTWQATRAADSEQE